MRDVLTLRPNSTPPEDEFRGRLGRARGSGGTSGKLGARLTKAMKGAKACGSLSARSDGSRAFGGDHRQRVVAKVSFHKHAIGGGGGGGGKLMAHAQYLERDGAAREGERGQFYDRVEDVAEDARERLQDWSVEDRRHFRVMLAPESGARLIGEDGDLKGFTRATMERMERDLGVKLDWVAVDHHNTDNPHTHVIVRGVRRDGVELLLPREYVSHGLREAARDIATEIIGERSPADERLRLDREIEGRSLNRLDRAIEDELNDRREVQLQSLGRGRSPEFADALRGRARELERIGLATETRRNVLSFEPDWIERLEAARPLDIRRELARGRLYEPRMGQVVGEVRELGPRGDNPDRALLVVETEGHGRLLLNTGMLEISELQQGSLVALHPNGHGAEIERLSFHPVEAQVHARANTVLDQDLDRVARGEARLLPALEGVESALAERADVLEAAGYGLKSDSGKFYFRDGAREDLRAAELDRAGLEHARDHGGVYRDLIEDNHLEPDQVWDVREVKELFAGKAAILGRGADIAVVALGGAPDINVGDEVGLRMLEGPGGEKVVGLIAPQEFAKSPDLGFDPGR